MKLSVQSINTDDYTYTRRDNVIRKHNRKNANAGSETFVYKNNAAAKRALSEFNSGK